MRCWHCNADLIWGADFSFEDYGEEGEGIYSTFTCSNVNCPTTVEVRYAITKED